MAPRIRLKDSERLAMFHPKGPTLWELARQALSSTTEGYDLLAPKFEYTPFRTPDELVGPLVEAAQRSDLGDALDLACGTGALTRQLAPCVTGRALGIDLSTGMIDEAKRLAAAEGAARAEFEVMDLFEMPFEEDFDVIVTAGAFGHILPPQQAEFADLVWRALRPGGRFIFITGHKPSKTNPAYWAARGFNAAMHIRNTLLDPPFIMFYLTFTVERASEVLWAKGFEIGVENPYEQTPYPAARLMIATKPTQEPASNRSASNLNPK